MEYTEELKTEHKAIKLALEIMEKMCQKLEAGNKVNPEHLESMVEFIRVFADKCHHGKEEGLLFPAMEEAGIPRTGGPIGVMLVEHDMGRRFVKGMSEAISAYKTGNIKASSEIIKNARGYAELLTQHINKEDNILYPLADMRLSAEKQKKLLEEFEKVEQEIIGAGKHEEFHELLNNFKKIYL